MNRSQGKVLVVHPEMAVQGVLGSALGELWFEVSGVRRGEEALTLVRTVRYDAVILNLAMPAMAGLHTCTELRNLRPNLGILMVTDYASKEMTIRALDAGADDYLVKPFDVPELAARLRALIRRSRVSGTATDCVITAGEIELDRARRTVTKLGKLIHLTPNEFDLLFCLMSNAGFPITHAQLLGAVWGPDHSEQVEYLRTFVGKLRKKLADDADAPNYLLTVSHVGYCFRVQPDSSADAQNSLLALEADLPNR